MTKRNADLRREFLNGATSGKASNMKIVEGPVTYNGETVVPEGATALVGYDWAVYAVKPPKGRGVTIHWGWHDWAKRKRQSASKPGQSTTERHMSNLKAAASDPLVTDRRPQCDSTPPSAREIERSPRRGILGR